jgi:DNA-binding response OmpR family regulator
MAGLQSKIMVVDDEPACLELFSEYLRNQGFEVVTASSGGEALMAFDFEEPDGILLDVSMQDMTGIEVLRQIRQKNARVGVLMVTAADDTAPAKEAQGLGAFGYVLKPVDLETLRRHVDRMLIASSMPAAHTAPAAASGGSPIYEFTLELFKATRQLPAAAHAAVGAALETAALTVLQRSTAGEKTDLGRSIAQVRTMLRLGRDLGDFTDEVYQRLDSLVATARRSLGFS